MRCERCKGLVIPEKTVAEGKIIEYLKCANCGRYECPPENKDRLIINRTVYNAAEKMRARKLVNRPDIRWG